MQQLGFDWVSFLLVSASPFVFLKMVEFRNFSRRQEVAVDIVQHFLFGLFTALPVVLLFHGTHGRNVPEFEPALFCLVVLAAAVLDAAFINAVVKRRASLLSIPGWLAGITLYVGYAAWYGGRF